MYPLLQSPIPTTSGLAHHRSDSSFKPIQLAPPSTASGPDTLGSANTLLNMIDNSQGTGSSPASSIPCAQKSPEQQTLQTSTGTSTHSHNLHNTLWQNVAQGQPPATNQQAPKQSPVAHQQQSSLLWPPAPGSHAASGHQVSHNLYGQWLAHNANLAGNQGNLPQLGKHSTHLPSLSFQQQRHSKIMMYPSHRSQKCPNPQMGKVSKMVDQIVIYVSAVDNRDIRRRTVH